MPLGRARYCREMLPYEFEKFLAGRRVQAKQNYTRRVMLLPEYKVSKILVGGEQNTVCLSGQDFHCGFPARNTDSSNARQAAA